MKRSGSITGDHSDNLSTISAARLASVIGDLVIFIYYSLLLLRLGFLFKSVFHCFVGFGRYGAPVPFDVGASE
jgi:hypothetical protein